MAFLNRYDLDRTRPDAATVRRDLLVRVLIPGIVLFGLLTGLGFLLKGPLNGLEVSEERINTYLANHRSPLWNSITAAWSHIDNTEYVIGVCILLVALMWWRTKEWWYAVAPGIAISVQAAAFVPATNLVDRPLPTVPHLDPAPPTSSFPSGHVGAATALYWTLAMMAQRIENRPLRRLVTLICAVIPLLVAYARLYRGMHHLVDVLVGFLNGVISQVIGWLWVRRDPQGHDAQTRA